MGKKSKSSGAGAARSAGASAGATHYDVELEAKMQEIMEDASRTCAVFKAPGRLPITKLYARKKRQKNAKFNSALIKRVVMHIQTRMIDKLRAANKTLSATEARGMLPRFDSAWVKKNAPFIEHIAVLRMRDEVRRMAEHRNTSLSDQPASGDRAEIGLKGKRVVICATPADLKNKELVLAGSRMASHEYLHPPGSARFLGTMRKFMAQKQARDNSVASSARHAQRAPAVRRDVLVEREMESV